MHPLCKLMPLRRGEGGEVGSGWLGVSKKEVGDDSTTMEWKKIYRQLGFGGKHKTHSKSLRSPRGGGEKTQHQNPRPLSLP